MKIHNIAQIVSIEFLPERKSEKYVFIEEDIRHWLLGLRKKRGWHEQNYWWSEYSYVGDLPIGYRSELSPDGSTGLFLKNRVRIEFSNGESRTLYFYDKEDCLRVFKKIEGELAELKLRLNLDEIVK